MDSHHTSRSAAGADQPPDLPPPLPSRGRSDRSPGGHPSQAGATRPAAGDSGHTRSSPAEHVRVRPRGTQDSDQGERAQLSPLAQSFVLWALLSLAFGILAVAVNTAPIVLRAGFFAKVFAVLVGAGLGATGAVIGDALRKFTRPDAFFTSGGMGQILWLKLFWMFGPQVIGMVAGTLLGIGLVLH